MTRKGQDLLGLAALMAMLALGSTLALLRIDVSQHTVDPLLNPSPLGYTFSLAMFVIPCVVLGVWIKRSQRTAEQRRAGFITMAVLIPLGCLLDLLFGKSFLTFPNLDATLGILVPAYDWQGGWSPFLPLEEFAFYALGFVAILLAYIWGDEILFSANKVDEHQRTPQVFRGWTRTILFWFTVGAVLFGVAWWIRGSAPARGQGAFPGYFLFLLVGSIVPSLLCARIAFQFINWRALTTSWLFILCISQFWEASLGIPYGWWGYVPDQMMGIFIRPHCDLPIEAVLVWTLGSWTTVIIYETVLTAIHAGRKGRGILGVVRAQESELETVKRKHLTKGGQPPHKVHSN